MSVMTGVLVAQDASLGDNFTSKWINVRTFPNFALHYWLTGAGTANGSIKFEVSCEDNPSISTSSNVALADTFVLNPIALGDLDPIAIASGEPAKGLLTFVDANYQWIRLVYTRTSGTGTLNARLSAKAGVP